MKMALFLRHTILQQNETKCFVKVLRTFHVLFREPKAMLSHISHSDTSTFQQQTFMGTNLGRKGMLSEDLPSRVIVQFKHSQNYLCIVRHYSNSFCNHHILPQKPVHSKLSRVGVRLAHSQSDQPWKSEMFTSFVKALVKEYRLLIEKISIEKLDEVQSLRLQFLRPVISVVESLQSKQSDISELEKLLEEETDKEMKGLLEKELKQFHEDADTIEMELVDTLVGEELADNNDIIMEVSAGVGGQEAMLFCAEVFHMYCNYAIFKGWTMGHISQDEAEGGGMRKASMEIGGEDVYKHLKHEAGVHRVQRVPRTERQGRMHTSTISVSVVPKPREIDIVVDSKDLKVETMRGSGPGGQSVNTTDSAVRMTHLPTGTVSECRQERSQMKNREIALERLKMKMYTGRLEEQEAKRRAARKMQTGTRSRSEKIRTYNFQQDRISDHRVKGNLNNVQGFMLGGEELDELLASLDLEEKYSSLRSMIDEHEQMERKTIGKS